MIKVGTTNRLLVDRSTSVGMYLVDSLANDVLLPLKYIPENLSIGDEIDVFVYTDSEDRIIATTIKPKIRLNEIAYLEVKAITDFGVFFDWGLEKDLFVPSSQIKDNIEVEDFAFVHLRLDEKTNRVYGSCKISKFIKTEVDEFELGQQVNLLIHEYTDLGVNVIVNNAYKGLVYGNEVFKRIPIGHSTIGFVKKIREDGKMDISLQKLGFDNLNDSSEQLLNHLKLNNGFLPFTDKSSADDIIEEFNMSKKTFKKAVGILYKAHKIALEKEGIRLTPNS